MQGKYKLNFSVKKKKYNIFAISANIQQVFCGLEFIELSMLYLETH